MNANRLAKLVTSLRKTIRASCHPRHTILGHSLYDLGQGTGNTIFYALSHAVTQCFKVALFKKHCKLVTVFHMVVEYNKSKYYKSKQFYMHASHVAELWDTCT